MSAHPGQAEPRLPLLHSLKVLFWICPWDPCPLPARSQPHVHLMKSHPATKPCRTHPPRSPSTSPVHPHPTRPSSTDGQQALRTSSQARPSSRAPQLRVRPGRLPQPCITLGGGCRGACSLDRPPTGEGRDTEAVGAWNTWRGQRRESRGRGPTLPPSSCPCLALPSRAVTSSRKPAGCGPLLSLPTPH